jgi:hypothetical protein
VKRGFASATPGQDIRKDIEPAKRAAAFEDMFMTDNEITIRETAQAEISGHLVGVGNIWERELPDNEGVIALRLSASISILEIASQQERSEKVSAGSVISLGADQYSVVGLEEGQSEPGSITLRQSN